MKTKKKERKGGVDGKRTAGPSAIHRGKERKRRQKSKQFSVCSEQKVVEHQNYDLKQIGYEGFQFS